MVERETWCRNSVCRAMRRGEGGEGIIEWGSEIVVGCSWFYRTLNGGGEGWRGVARRGGHGDMTERGWILDPYWEWYWDWMDEMD